MIELVKERVDLLWERHRGRGCGRIDATDLRVTMGEVEKRPDHRKTWLLPSHEVSTKRGQITAIHP